MKRREFLAAGAGFTASSVSLTAAGHHAAWDQVPAILARIKAPVFPNRDFDITRYGAVGDGQKDSTEAI